MVDGDALGAGGGAFTLTARDRPPSAEEWTATRTQLMKRLRRAGMERGQWLTEFTRRGVPHLHGCVWGVDGAEVVEHWLEVAGRWGAGPAGQHVRSLDGLAGWLKYQAKHSSRGVRHYQRASLPAEWDKSGRLWGFVGDWPLREEVYNVPVLTFHRFRRAMRAYLVAEARAQGDLTGAAHLRGLLRDPDPARSAVRAVGGFCPEAVSQRLVAWSHGGGLGVVGP